MNLALLTQRATWRSATGLPVVPHLAAGRQDSNTKSHGADRDGDRLVCGACDAGGDITASGRAPSRVVNRLAMGAAGADCQRDNGNVQVRPALGAPYSNSCEATAAVLGGECPLLQSGTRARSADKCPMTRAYGTKGPVRQSFEIPSRSHGLGYRGCRLVARRSSDPSSGDVKGLLPELARRGFGLAGRFSNGPGAHEQCRFSCGESARMRGETQLLN